MSSLRLSPELRTSAPIAVPGSGGSFDDSNAGGSNFALERTAIHVRALLPPSSRRRSARALGVVRALAFALVLLATSPAYAAGFFVREAKQLCVLRDAVAKDPTEQNILAYLRAFPDTFPKLVATAFQESMQTPTCSGQLHVRLLNEIFQMHLREVLAAELRASIGGVSIPDGPNLFQEAVGHHAATSAALFAGELLKLNAAERESVLEFLVDWEGGPTEDMRRLVVELRQLHFNALADSIELAMKVRGLRYDA